MEQYSQPTLTADYARRGKLFDLGRKLFIIFIPLAVALSIIDTCGFIFAKSEWRDIWMSNETLMNFVMQILPSILIIIPGIILIFSDKRFRLFGTLFALAYILSIPPFVISLSRYTIYFSRSFSISLIIISLLSLYQVFSNVSINRRVALILFLNVIILGSIFSFTEIFYLGTERIPYVELAQTTNSTLKFYYCIYLYGSFLSKILLAIFFYQIGDSETVCDNLGTDEDYSVADFFRSRYFGGALFIILFLVSSIYAIRILTF